MPRPAVSIKSRPAVVVAALIATSTTAVLYFTRSTIHPAGTAKIGRTYRAEYRAPKKTR